MTRRQFLLGAGAAVGAAAVGLSGVVSPSNGEVGAEPSAPRLAVLPEPGGRAFDGGFSAAFA